MRTAGLLLVGVAAACAGDGDPAGPGAPPCAAAVVAYPDPPAPVGGTRHVHDPEVVRVGDAYYVLSTHDGVPIRRSEDLVRWEVVGRVFPEGYPSWAPSQVPGVEGVWAPGVGHFNGRYHLYYSLSTFGSPRSVIGLATTPTIDPTDPAYGWTDHGKVVESFQGYGYNAIDAAVIRDDAGGVWLAWGSWGGGIVMRELDPATGMPSTSNDSLYPLARRPVEQALEGPYIVQRGGYYYLFVSFDLCCRGVESTYSVRVGRSRSVTGPYVDRRGGSMMQGGGTPVLDGYGPVIGPGHASVLARDDGYLLVHHYYDARDQGVPHLQVRPLAWDEDGWPMAGLPYAGGPLGSPPPGVDLAGPWGFWSGGRPARSVELRADGTAVACDREGRWSYDAPHLTVEWAAGGAGGPAGAVTGVLGPEGTTLVGRDPDGSIVRAYRTDR